MELKGLPPGVSYPSANPEPFILPKETIAKASSAGGLATFLTNVLKIQVDIKSQSTFTVNQITATREFIADQNANLTNKAVVAWLVQWKASKCDAYIVTAVLDTKSLSINSNSLKAGDVQFNGTSVPACNAVKTPQVDPGSPNTQAVVKPVPKAAPPTGPTPSPQAPGTAAQSTPPAPAAKLNASTPSAVTVQVGSIKLTLPEVTQSTGSTATPASGASGTTIAGAVDGAASKTLPSYGLYGCFGSDTQLLLAAENPVAIAVQINPITLPSAIARLSQTEIANLEFKPNDPAPSALPVPHQFRPGTTVMSVPFETVGDGGVSGNFDSILKISDDTVISVNTNATGVTKDSIQNNMQVQRAVEDQIKAQQQKKAIDGKIE